MSLKHEPSSEPLHISANQSGRDPQVMIAKGRVFKQAIPDAPPPEEGAVVEELVPLEVLVPPAGTPKPKTLNSAP